MRTPNAQCCVCSKPLYRRPFELATIRYVACVEHRVQAQKAAGMTERQGAGLRRSKSGDNRSPEERRAAQLEYWRAWARANRERKNDTAREWRAANRERCIAHTKKWQEKHPEYGTPTRRKWRERHPGKDVARNRARREENPGKARADLANWRAERKAKDPVGVKAKTAAGRAKRRALAKNSASHFTVADVRRQLAGQKGKCWWCRKKLDAKYHVDHRIPLSRGGDDGPENIVIACVRCNVTKGAKLPAEFAGLLL